MRDLRVALVQAATVWRDAAANRTLYGDLVRPLAARADLVVLPETFLSGFSNDAIANAESMDGEGMAWMAGLARETDAVITGSLVMRVGDKVFNRLIWMRPDGTHASYDKRHLFRMALEHERYAGGSERLIVELHGWRICPQVCYDLRFPVWSRNRYDAAAVRMDYDLLLFVANWPNPRRYAWSTLLRARAIENLSYCIGVNRVGTDGHQLTYAGDSAVLDFMGQPLVELGEQANVVTAVLSGEHLMQWRERFPAHRDADQFELT